MASSAPDHLRTPGLISNRPCYEGIKLIYTRNGSAEEEHTLYGPDSEELVERVRSMGIHQFTVSRTNLEDVYLALTGEREALDADSS